MADERGRSDYPEFDVSEIFTDFRTHSDGEYRNENNKQKFIVHIDDSVQDSFDYDFSAFSSADDRINEEKRRKETQDSFRQFEEEIGLYEQEYKTPRQTVPYESPAQGSKKRGINNRPVYDPVPVTSVHDVFENRESGAPSQKSVRKPVPAQPVKKRTKKPVEKSPELENKAGVSPEMLMASKQISENIMEESPEKKVVRLKTRSKSGLFTGFFGFIAIVLVFTLLLSSIGLSTIGDIIAYNRGETSVTVVIENEKNGNSPTLEHVIDALHSAGLIKQKYLCLLFAKFRHYDGYTDSEKVWVPTEYLSGVYYLEPSLGIEGMLNTIKKSTSAGAYTVTLTFPEGWTISQIFERLEKNDVCEASKLYANIETVAKQYDFYYNINQSGLRYLGVEGYLFPDTYDFYKNENAVSVLRKLFDNSDAKWTKAYEKKAKELGYTRDEILNIASIIQREAANSSQMGDVSSVLHNRLKSPTYPSIQSNATLDYVTNSVKDHVDANMAEVYSNAYNTYRIEGLPPGPICNPGIDAIEAALNPNDTNYYFFVHNNNGKIYLSETYAQFQQDCVQVAKDNAS